MTAPTKGPIFPDEPPSTVVKTNECSPVNGAKSCLSWRASNSSHKAATVARLRSSASTPLRVPLAALMICVLSAAVVSPVSASWLRTCVGVSACVVAVAAAAARSQRIWRSCSLCVNGSSSQKMLQPTCAVKVNEQKAAALVSNHAFGPGNAATLAKLVLSLVFGFSDSLRENRCAVGAATDPRRAAGPRRWPALPLEPES